jgi:hypothetical protein
LWRGVKGRRSMLHVGTAIAKPAKPSPTATMQQKLRKG